MKARRAGTLIHISSVAGRKTLPDHAVYCGSKFAVSAISEALRAELAEYDVRVISICPGAVETELLAHTRAANIRAAYTRWKQSIGGALHPDDIARAVHFAYAQPQLTCIREIVLAPTRQVA